MSSTTSGERLVTFRREAPLDAALSEWMVRGMTAAAWPLARLVPEAQGLNGSDVEGWARPVSQVGIRRDQ